MLPLTQPLTCKTKKIVIKDCQQYIRYILAIEFWLSRQHSIDTTFDTRFVCCGWWVFVFVCLFVCFVFLLFLVGPTNEKIELF